MDPYYQDDAVTIYHGDCREILPGLTPADAIVTSPPYAMQRKDQYGGVVTAEYPTFTLEWMNAAQLVPSGSALINIREHIADGEMSDYVHLTRLRLRSSQWIECDELIWIKPDAPPLGNPFRPRRSWERILWFSRQRQPICYPKANGQATRRLGFIAGTNTASWTNGDSNGRHAGDARQADHVSVSIRSNPNGVTHPAAFPPQLAGWMARLVTAERDTVLDPFMGSGTTLFAAKHGGRKAIGIEINESYCETAARRMCQEVLELGA